MFNLILIVAIYVLFYVSVVINIYTHVSSIDVFYLSSFPRIFTYMCIRVYMYTCIFMCRYFETTLTFFIIICANIVGKWENSLNC